MRRWLCRKKKEEREGGTGLWSPGVSRCVCLLDVHKGRKRSEGSDNVVIPSKFFQNIYPCLDVRSFFILSSTLD